MSKNMKLLVFLGIGMQACSLFAFWCAWQVSKLPERGFVTGADLHRTLDRAIADGWQPPAEGERR